MDNKKNGIPKLRFPGFTGAWEQRKLSSMTQYKNGKGHEDKQTDSGDFELVNLNSISIDGGFKHSGKFINESDDGILYKNDLVMILSDVGHGDLLGRVALIPDDNKFILNQRVALLRPNKTVNPEFLFFYINSHQKYFKSQGAGMSQLNISKKSVETFSSLVPNIDEQKKISLFLMKLDSLIALHQRKLEHLQEQKKGLLQKMFPKNGETVPEVRFPGFTDAWEQRKLGEVAEINPSSEIPDNFEYVDLESVVGTEMIAYRRENKKTAPSRAQRLAKKGDIFYQTVRPYQKNNYHFNLTRKDFVFSTGYAQLRPNINGDFLFVYIQLSNFVNEVLNRSTGTSYPAISPSNLIRMKVAIPTNNEQEKIGAFFKQLDSLIALHQRKVKYLISTSVVYL